MLTETLTWHPVAEPPDADITVLLWLAEEGLDPADWCAGWWDGEDWRDCASGGVIERTVTHWAQPEGPQC